MAFTQTWQVTILALFVLLAIRVFARNRPHLAYLLTRMRHENGFPEPIGVFRCVDAPRYDELINDQVDDAIRERGKGDLEDLFNSGDTWTVQ